MKIRFLQLCLKKEKKKPAKEAVSLEVEMSESSDITDLVIR